MIYLETSAAAKLLVEEAESTAVAEYLDGQSTEVDVVSSVLTETELRRLAVREDLAQTAVTATLERISLAEPDRSLYVEAGFLPGPNLRSLDALHIATALRLDVSTIVAYDGRVRGAAELLGLPVRAPA